MAVDPEFNIEEESIQLHCLSESFSLPSSEAYRLIQQTHRDKGKIQRNLSHGKGELEKALTLLAIEVFDFKKYLRGFKERSSQSVKPHDTKGLEILLSRMQGILIRNEFEMVDLTGQTLNHELLDYVEILKSIVDDTVTEPTVRETKTPVVYYRGKIIQEGVVIASIPPPTEGGKIHV